MAMITTLALVAGTISATHVALAGFAIVVGIVGMLWGVGRILGRMDESSLH